MTYVIKNWDALFETAETKKLIKLRWVPVPNKHDGKSFRRLSNMKERCDWFSAWILILQIASKMPVRGVLKDEDGPLTCDDMSMMTGFPEDLFINALEILSDPKIGWITKEEPTATEADERTVQAANSGSNAGQSSGVPAESPGNTGSSPAEGKGREWNGKNGSVKSVREDKIFDLRTVEDAVLAGKTLGLPESEAKNFWHKYEGQGWVNGNGVPIVNRFSQMHVWKSKWERDQATSQPGAKAGGSSGSINSIPQADSVIKECEDAIKRVKKDRKSFEYYKDDFDISRERLNQAAIAEISKIESRIKEARAYKTNRGD